MKIIYRGAESIIYLDKFDGQNVLVKERVKKNFRLEQIDEKLRKERTRKEVKLLTESRKYNVLTPKIINVDFQKHKIIMENIDGIRIKEFLNTADKKNLQKVSMDIGKLIGRLHANNIIHGDLTTSNMLLKDSQIYFIDFSLGEFSNRMEDKGVDLNLLYEALKATHFKNFKICWDNILKGYKQEYSEGNKVLEKVKEIEKRARYMAR
ncbi:MAG: Kae1-associated kinase Bud32 [Nitrospirae bacterium RBG_13_43_8]|nr:MAG: Kae1-associated kinase Bud32 [Nitrospirae bacterium RBG_13_43_8]